MLSKRFHGTLILIAALILPCCPTAWGNEEEESDEGLVARLAEQWKVQRWGLVTAEIKFIAVHRIPTGKLSPDDVHALLKEADLPGTDASIKKLIGALDANLAGVPEPWSVKLFTFDGLNTRVDRFSQKLRDSHVRTADSEVYTRRINNQIDVYLGERSRIHLDSLEDLWILPSERFAEGAPIVARRQDGKITLRRGGEEFVVDPKTAFVFERRFVLSNEIERRETFQYGPKTYAGGIIFPTVVFEAKYRNRKLERFTLNAIVAATFNGQIPGSAFVVPAKKGMTVVDYEDGRKQVHSLDRNVPDITNRQK